MLLLIKQMQMQGRKNKEGEGQRAGGRDNVGGLDEEIKKNYNNLQRPFG